MAESLSKPDLGKVAVIGGAGFLGSHIVDALASTCKAEIYVISRSASKYAYKHADVKYVDADLTKVVNGKSELQSVFEENKIEVVFHAATPPSMRASNKAFQDVNIIGSKNAVVAAQKSGVKAFIYTSSMAVVRKSFATGAENADESWPLIMEDQEDAYTASKAEAEKFVLAANKPGGLRTCTLRPGGMIGIRDNLVTPSISELYFNGNPNIQMGDNTANVDYGSVLDTAAVHASAAIALLRAHSSPTLIPDSERVDGEAFFVTGEHTQFWTMARKFYTHYGDKATKEPTVLSRGTALILARIMTFLFGLVGKKSPLTVKDVYYICAPATANNSKAKERLGYKVRESLDVAVEKAAKWYAENKRPKTE